MLLEKFDEMSAKGLLLNKGQASNCAFCAEAVCLESIRSATALQAARALLNMEKAATAHKGSLPESGPGWLSAIRFFSLSSSFSASTICI